MTSESQPGNSAEALQAEPENVHEIVIGLTRAIGIDTQPICTSLTKKLGNTYGYDVADIVKVSKLFQLVNSDLNLVDESEGQFSYLVSRMNFGDALRQRFKAAPGLLAAADISRKRRLLPRGAKKAFIIDSLMHPDEIRALRELYGQSFYLIALTDDAMKRKQSIIDSIQDRDSNRAELGPDQIEEYDKSRESQLDRIASALMLRDRGDPAWRTRLSHEDVGTLGPIAEPDVPQSARVDVRTSFTLADLFLSAGSADSEDQIDRFLRLVFGDPFCTPTVDEIGMAHAYVARRASGSLARQVGAAISTAGGDLIASGSNEVPRFGGGQYHGPDAYTSEISNVLSDRIGDVTRPQRDIEFKFYDDTLHQWLEGVDPNDRIKLSMFAEFLSILQANMELGFGDGGSRATSTLSSTESVIDDLMKMPQVSASTFFDVIEYTRSVHAEMHALLSCAKRGVATEGSVLYTTTFPCHECARHIVAAGIARVVFLEPYPKSRVAQLHPDSIVILGYTDLADELGADPRHRVQFVPFIGVSPDCQPSAFSWKERKNKITTGAKSAGRKKHWGPSRKSVPRNVKISPVPWLEVIDKTFAREIKEEATRAQLVRGGILAESEFPPLQGI